MSLHNGLKSIDRMMYRAYTKYLWFKIAMCLAGGLTFCYIVYTFIKNFIILFF